MQPKKYYLPVIVFAQFAGTSLWFAGNAVIGDINISGSGTSVAHITSMVQFGFIAGTLLFAFFNIADRYKPTAVFFFCCCLAALANALTVVTAKNIFFITMLRFATGFFLAGIYPVGMKIAADIFPRTLGNALGYLVGALVLGTAFPHLLRSQLQALPWSYVMLCTSLLAVMGGIMVLALVPSSPSLHRKKFEPAAIVHIFRSPGLRSAAFGYFGHMWELYTLWAFVPLLVAMHPQELNTSLWSFMIIASGTLGCMAGGWLSTPWGSRKVALAALIISALCCLLLPFMQPLSAPVYLAFLIVWGMAVVADSPQFSTLVAQAADPAYKGTALTIVTSIGFAITIISIQLLQGFFEGSGKTFWLLAPGPLFGVWALLSQKKNH